MANISDIFRIVVRNMLEKKKRVFLTISGIIIGIFTFTFFIFLSQGLSNAITEQFSSFGLNVLAIRPYDAPQGGPPQGAGLTDTEISKIKQVTSDYKYVAPFIFYTTQFEYARQKTAITTLAYPDKYWDDVQGDLGTEIDKGRNIRPGDKGALVLGAKIAREGFGPDKEVRVGSSLKYNGKSYRVIGVLKERGDLFVDNSILTSFSDIKEISGQDTYSGIRASFYENANLDDMREAILRKLNPNNEEKQVSITSPEQAIEQFNNILGVLTMIIGFVSTIALIVGGINVMNTMYSNVIERINEISVMKAIGATNSDVRWLYLVESGSLGFMGAFIGFMLSFALAKFLSYIITTVAKFNVPVFWQTDFFLQVTLITALAAMLFGTYPAIKASGIDPADNLRDE